MAADRIGKYRLIRMLASGGMGEVYLARQEGPAGFAKPAVVKTILPHLAREESFIEMFLNEARLAALLQHPNCVQIFELGEDNGTWFIAMEFIHGKTLRSARQQLKANERPFPPGQLARICAQALNGLHYAHTLQGEGGEPIGIVHRDMSPDNVMVGFNGTVKVLDFGIAKASTAVTTTRTGTVKGKFAYMSPEQLNAQPVDGRSDLWAVGVLLYELLAGGRPFTAPIEAAIVNLILNSEPAPLAQRAPQAPAELVAIVERAMQKDRDRRFANAEEMSAALEAFAANENEPLTNGSTSAFLRGIFPQDALENPAMVTPSAERPLPGTVDVELDDTHAAIATGARPKRRSRALPILVGAVAFVLVGAGAGLLLNRPQPEPVAPPPAPPPSAPVAVAQPVEPKPAPEPTPAPEPAPAPEPTGAAAAAAPTRGAHPKPTVKPGAGSGKLDLRVNPWAEVFEGKKSLGVTPMPPIELSAGTHVLRLENSEVKVSRTVTVKVPKNATVVQRVDLMD